MEPSAEMRVTAGGTVAGEDEGVNERMNQRNSCCQTEDIPQNNDDVLVG